MLLLVALLHSNQTALDNELCDKRDDLRQYNQAMCMDSCRA
jgi:hypothetical protein